MVEVWDVSLVEMSDFIMMSNISIKKMLILIFLLMLLMI